MTETFEIHTEHRIDSFLMIGQSNMAGIGNLSDVEPIKNTSCFMLRNGLWTSMSEPINPDRAITGEFPSGVSLGASFADQYAKYSRRTVGMIPCADGGTVIAQWQKGEVLFDHAVMMTRLAMRSSNLKGILWHQGETDCLTFESVAEYPTKFLRFISALREEFPSTPIIVGELSEKITNRGRTDKIFVFNRQLRELAAGIENCALVSVEGVTLKPDNIHFDFKSLRELGRRYFAGYCGLAGYEK